MNAGHPLDFTALVDDLNTNLDPLFLFVFGSTHSFEDLISNIETGDKVFHVAGHPQGAGRGHPGQDKDLLVQAQLTDRRHEFGETLHVINDLGLDKIGPAGDLFGQTGGSGRLVWPGKGIGGTTQKKTGFMILNHFPTLKLFLIPQVFHHP